MGVIRWLDRIDPVKWNKACVRLVDDPPGDRASAEEFLSSFNRGLNEYILAEYDMLGEYADHIQLVHNKLLEEATSEERWELDKSLSHGIEEIPVWLPELRCFRKIFDFHGMDVLPPQSCGSTDCGLFGCISSGNLADCVTVMERYPSLKVVRDALRQIKPGILTRLSGRGSKPVDLANRIEDEYFTECYADFCASIRRTVEKAHYLGLGMSV